MRMTTRIAFENMKYHKSKNILIGIAILLTTFLLFVIPTVGNGIISAQHEATKRLYPTWHALYRNVDEKTAGKLAAHHDIEAYGLRSDLGVMKLENADCSMICLDEAGAEMYKAKLLEGHLPVEENEIVISEGILEALGQTGKMGDKITVPYQVYRDGSLDYAQEREFIICGFLEESETSRRERLYLSMVSMSCIKSEIPQDNIKYRFLFQIRDWDYTTTDQLDHVIKNIAEQFGIDKNDININEEYLEANYVDPSTLPVIAAIMAVIVIAAIITIYSIYYVSMNQRIQDFGKLGAIGATRRQIRQIVLREGLWVSMITIPAGLILGTVISRMILLAFTNVSFQDDDFIQTVTEVIQNQEAPIYHLWIYLLVIVITLCSIYISLMKPMRIAAKISQTDAIRYYGSTKKKRSCRKGYSFLTVSRLTKRNLFDNKKKSMITVLSMAATGTLLIVVSTVLSCANPTEAVNSMIVGKYEITPLLEFNNKEHPEREWSYIQQNNPLDDELKEKIELFDGVERVDIFSAVMVSGEIFDEGDEQWISGIPENYASQLEKGIIKGNVTYEQLKSGDKVIMDQNLQHWYPELDVGTKMNLKIHDGERTYEKEIEIAAIGNYGHGLTQYQYLIMAKEAADRLSSYNSSRFFQVEADQNYDPALEQSLKDVISSFENLGMKTWKEEYEIYKVNIAIIGGACYTLLGILAIISVMNLINTMINSVYARKKELGMIQAIGMSDMQLLKMLQLEGLFYTVGTLAFSIIFGSLIGYQFYLYARESGIFEIRNYHYPFGATAVVSVILLLIQVILACLISKSVKRDSLIERIRFSE